jgi:hypothetical protein
MKVAGSSGSHCPYFLFCFFVLKQSIVNRLLSRLWGFVHPLTGNSSLLLFTDACNFRIFSSLLNAMDYTALEKNILDRPYDYKTPQCEFRKLLSFYQKFFKRQKAVVSVKPAFNIPSRNNTPLTPSQQEAFDFVNKFLCRYSNKQSSDQLFFGCISPGGYGKSHLLKSICNALSSRNLVYKVIAYTAVSAAVCDGQTCHSFLGLDYMRGGGPSEWAQKPASLKLKRNVKNLEFILIDEVGFLNCEFFGLISRRLQKAKNNQKPFGGVSVLIFGDFHQLPPIFPYELYSDKVDPFTFGGYGKSLFEKFQIFELKENVRAFTDIDFQQTLLRFRTRTVYGSDIDKLRSRQLKNLERDEKAMFHDALHVFPRNVLVHYWNHKKLLELDSPIAKIVPKQTPALPLLPKEETLYLCNKAPVFLTRNIDFPRRLLNGSRGTVHSIFYKPGTSPATSLPSVVFVHFEKYNGPAAEVRDGLSLVPICPMSDTYFNKGLRQSFSVRIIPLKLAFATTVHGVQSQTLSRYVIHFDRREYFFGQTYVCLSRATSMKSFAVFDKELLSDRFSSDAITRQYSCFLSKLEKLYDPEGVRVPFKRQLKDSVDEKSAKVARETD